MGYNTEFYGSIDVEPAIKPELIEYLDRLANTRRMKRDVAKLQEKFKGDWGLDGEYGDEGEFFVGGSGGGFLNKDGTVIDNNRPPESQPGLWCQWIINDNGAIAWDGVEKFYEAERWMEYLIDKILAPRGYVCNGEIEAQGDDKDDMWKLVVEDNKVKRLEGSIVYEEK